MTRKGFIAALLAPLVARFAPKPKPTLPKLGLLFHKDVFALTWPAGLKIGDMITIPKPSRFIVDGDRWTYQQDYECRVIQNQADLEYARRML